MLNITASLVSKDQLGENPQLTLKSLEQVSVLLSRQMLSGLKQ
jgi:hypothetical protein